MRKPFMAGNWKMHMDNSQARELASGLAGRIGQVEAVDIVLCPPFTALTTVAQAIEGTKIALGAQDIFWEDMGAYTGEISPSMLLSCGCSYVIVGHSERRGRFSAWPEEWPDELRAVFGDNDTTVTWKAAAALEAGLTPIICVGETIEEREKGLTDAIVRDQVLAALQRIRQGDIPKVIFAYEPVWAIGTGQVCEAGEANRVIGMIRQVLAEKVGDAAQNMRILYGGSIKPGNVEELMQQPEIDGGLVGGASLKVDDFSQIVETAARVKGA